MKRIKEFMIELMDKAKKCYSKLFKKCLTTKEAKAKAKPRRNVKTKKVAKKS
tara:strand:- start:34 stop:189 length:156 start_codon:yes stop_codon:yes gene_type:complete